MRGVDYGGWKTNLRSTLYVLLGVQGGAPKLRDPLYLSYCLGD